MRVRALAMAATFVLLVPAHARAAPRAVRFGTAVPDGSPWMETIDKLGAAMARHSNGEIALKVFNSAMAGDELELARMLQAGKLEVAGLSGGALFEVFPEAAVLELPFLFRNQEEADRVVLRLLPELRAAAARRGLWFVGAGHIGFRHLGTRVPVPTVKELRAIRMRSQPSPAHRRLWEVLGRGLAQERA